jgi:hypothetical protein
MRYASLLLMTVSFTGQASAQDPPVSWQRSTQATTVPVTVFHSTQSANLPTAETLQTGEWLFEVSHRFLPTLSDGADALWGLDGPIFNRIGLAYAVTDRATVGVLRSNLDDNLELDVKYRIWEARAASIPIILGAMGGMAWNTEVEAAGGRTANEMQAYAQLILNALVGKRLALGLVPSFLHNPRIDDTDAERTLSVGLNAQVYASASMSFLAEWILSESRVDSDYDVGTFGIEMETGGHFFQFVLTNTGRLNPTQVLAGTPSQFEPDEWRLGFNITRLLRF